MAPTAENEYTGTRQHGMRSKLAMNGYVRKDFSTDADFEFEGEKRPVEVLPDIGRREAQRGGPGTAARRTLEALAETRRLSRELAELDGFDDL